MVNWAFLLLAMGGLRLALENINKYGNGELCVCPL